MSTGLTDKVRVRELYERMGVGYLELYLRDSVEGYLSIVDGVGIRGVRVIDVGCGLGIGAGLLSGLAGQYVCVDFACSILQYPARLPNVDVLCSDGSMLPIRDLAFKVAILLNVVNADIDGPQLINEARRVSELVLAKSPRNIDNELISSLLEGANAFKQY
ncbi:MAG: methyltransferase domain-containing protein [Caldivirga sp.]